MMRRPPRSTLFPYTTPLPICDGEYDHRCGRRRVADPCTSLPLRDSPTRCGNAESCRITADSNRRRSEEHTSELQSRQYLVCRLLLEKKISIIVLPRI